MKNFLKDVATCLLIMIIAYAFLSLCNWNLNVGDWNGFSRFILGVVGVVLLVKLIDDFI